MGKVTDRILWSVLILALGVSLYSFGKPAFSALVHGSIQPLSHLTKQWDGATPADDDDLVDDSSNSDFSYSDPNTTDHTISIVGYSGHEETLNIPQYRKVGSVSYKVTSISHDAFRENESIKKLIIPDSVRTIEYNAFWHDSNLQSLTLGSGVTSIGDWAFQYTALTSVDIPDSVTSIGSGAFYRCYYLKHLTLGSGVTSIGDCAFQVTGLTRVDFPASVRSVGDYAFQWSQQLSAISFKKSVDLGHESFTHTNLTNATLPTGSTYNTDANNQTFDANVKVTVE